MIPFALSFIARYFFPKYSLFCSENIMESKCSCFSCVLFSQRIFQSDAAAAAKAAAAAAQTNSSSSATAAAAEEDEGFVVLDDVDVTVTDSNNTKDAAGSSAHSSSATLTGQHKRDLEEVEERVVAKRQREV